VIPWKIWLWISVFLGAGELLVLGKTDRMLYLGSLAGGAAAAAIVAAAGARWPVDVAVFVGVSLVAAFMLRPVAHRFLEERDARRGGSDGS
jgi:membrane protein implicated in regulation of membrane protease activity